MHLKSAFEIGFVFNRFTLGDACLGKIRIYSRSNTTDWNFNLLEALGFTDEQIDAANDYICGTMTVEGAPLLKRRASYQYLIVLINVVKKVRDLFMHMVTFV